MEFNRFGMKFDSNDDLLHNEKKSCYDVGTK